jgi:putative transcriptional regulator
MTPVHHPTDETLLGFATGGLDEAYRVVVATHLGHCPSCRAAVLAAERVGGLVLEGLDAAPLADGALERTLARLGDAGPPPPPPPPPGMPASLAGYRLGRWRSIAPGLAISTILPPKSGRAALHALRVVPGMRLANHGHVGLELTTVLQGAFADSGERYAAGDVAEHDEADDHAPVALPGETCVCLIAFSGKLRFRHWLPRLVQPFFGV